MGNGDDPNFDDDNDNLTLMAMIVIVLLSSPIDLDVHYENYHDTIEGVQRKVKVKISLIPPNHSYQVQCQRLCGGAPPTA